MRKGRKMITMTTTGMITMERITTMRTMDNRRMKKVKKQRSRARARTRKVKEF